MTATWSGLGWPRDEAEARVAARPDHDSHGLGWSDAGAVLARSESAALPVAVAARIGAVASGNERDAADASGEAGGIEDWTGAGRFPVAGHGTGDGSKIVAREARVLSGARDGDLSVASTAARLPAATLRPAPSPVRSLPPAHRGTVPGVGWPGPDARASAVMLGRASWRSGRRMPVREDMRSSSVLARGTLAPAAIHYESGIGWPGPVADSAEPGTKRSGAESPDHSGGTAGDLVPGTASPVGVHDDRPAEAVSRETGVGAGAVPTDAGLRVRPERSYPPARVPEDPTAGDSMRRGPAAWPGERSAPDLGLRAAGSGDGGQPVRSSTGWPGPEPGGGVGVGAGEPEVSESPEPWSAAGESGLGWFTAEQTSDQVAEGTGQAAIADAGAANPGGVRPGGPVPGAATFGGSDRPDADQAAVGSDWRLPVAGTGEAGTGEAEAGEADAGSTGGYLAGDWDADLPGGTGSPGATGGPGRHAAAERIGGGERIAPRHGRPLGWYAAESEGVWPDRGNQVDVPPGAGSDLPDNRFRAGEVRSWGTSQPPGGPMIADGISYGARSAPASESEDEVAIPAAPDASADTPIARAAQAAMKARAASRPWPKPRSCRIMTIANQKGGVGKTTTAVNMAASLAMHGARVLVVDLDPQGNASTALDVEHRAGTSSIYHVLVEGRPLQDVIQQVAGFPYLYCAPATIDLAGAEIELVPLVAREARLGRAIAEFDTAELDYVLIDCPPSLGLLTVNALVAAPEVLIPIQCEYYALEGLEQLLRTIELVKSHLNPGLSVSTILLTMFDSRTRLASQVAEEVRSHFGDLVLSSVIPRSVRVSEAPSYGQSVMTYDPGSNGAVAYLEAAREMAYRSDGAG